MVLQDHAHLARPARALRLYMQARECEARERGGAALGGQHGGACACVPGGARIQQMNAAEAEQTPCMRLETKRSQRSYRPDR